MGIVTYIHPTQFYIDHHEQNDSCYCILTIYYSVGASRGASRGTSLRKSALTQSTPSILLRDGGADMPDGGEGGHIGWRVGSAGEGGEGGRGGRGGGEGRQRGGIKRGGTVINPLQRTQQVI